MQVLKKEIDDQIKEVALELFAQNGFIKTTMNQIAKKSNISVGNIYKYYKNKNNLFLSLITPVYDILREIILQVYNYYSTHPSPEIGIETRFINTTKELISIIAKNRLEVLILLTGSEGTNFENLKYEFIEMFEQNLKLYIKDVKGDSFLFDDYNKLVIHISYKNMINGISEIIKYYSNEYDIINAINILYKNHLYGINGLLDE